jgi:hypothetical protein
LDNLKAFLKDVLEFDGLKILIAEPMAKILGPKVTEADIDSIQEVLLKSPHLDPFITARGIKDTGTFLRQFDYMFCRMVLLDVAEIVVKNRKQ